MINSNLIGIIKQSQPVVIKNKDIIKATINVAEMPEPKYQTYSGSYEIFSAKTEQVLPTQYKLMSQDLRIQGIYYHEELTPAGGKIVTIGSD